MDPILHEKRKGTGQNLKVSEKEGQITQKGYIAGRIPKENIDKINLLVSKQIYRTKGHFIDRATLLLLENHKKFFEGKKQ